MSFIRQQVPGSQANPDFVYYNATIVNNTVQTTQQADDPNITFQDTRQSAIIKDSSQYNVAVQNFSINGGTKSLPVFIPTIAPTSSTDVTTTAYTITLSVFDGSAYHQSTQSIIWKPENITAFTQIPLTATPLQLESDYYYCYTYTHWVDLMNQALQAAWTAAGGGSSFGTQCPFFEFDETTGLFSLSQDANTSVIPYGSTLPQPFHVASSSSSPTGKAYTSGEYSFVGMNANLEGLLANFDTVYYADGQSWQGQSYTLPECVFNFGLTNLLSGSVGGSPVGVSLKTKPQVSSYQLTNPFTGGLITNAYFVRQTQDFISTGTLWSPIASFVLGTSQIPVRMENSSNPISIGSANIGSNGSAANFQKVLLEVPINAVTADLWRGWVLYEPLVPTFSSLDPVHDGVTQLDVSVYWRNRLTNSLTPLKLYNSGTMSLRLKLQRRDVGV